MFKLESYITPLLMGYIDKYVKLKKEDFQLSLWGGDAVLNKLDLRLDAIEHALNLPISFKSGQIYELRIHVPWTKLGSEPVVITINTIECIIKLKDSGTSSDTDSTSTTKSSTRPAVAKPKIKSRELEEDLPPGYLQSLINRIVNNVNIVVNNLIVKFVEDDIVLSINVKSAECYSVNQDWIRSFIELSMPELVLRRVINFHDLTVCLDKRNASGKIEHYQDPLLYRCSLTCRMHLTYDSLTAMMPSVTRFNIFCEKLDISLTDTQVPMFVRLLELIIAIYYGSLKEPEDPLLTKAPIESSVDRDGPATSGALEDEQELALDDQQGWASWAWSYVPSLLPPDEWEEEQEEQRRKRRRDPPILSIGLYIKKGSITFKLTEYQHETTLSSPPKLVFHPCISVTGEGITMEVLARGATFVDVQFAISTIKFLSQGQSICGVKDVDENKESWFLRAGSPLADKPPINVNYLSHSLFDPGGAENQHERPTYIYDGDKHQEVYTEMFAMQRFGALWIDYLYFATRDENAKGSKSSAASHSDEDSSKENATLRILVCPLHLIVSSSMVQRIHKFVHCITDHEYEPYMKSQPETTEEKHRPVASEEQVATLEKFIPTRTYHLTFLKPSIWVQANNLPTYDVTKKWTSLHSKSKNQSKRKALSSQKAALTATTSPLPMAVLHTERIDFQMTSAMYCKNLVSVVSRLSAPSGNLLHHCHSHIHIKVFSFQAGVTYMEVNGITAPVQNVIQPWSGAFYKRSLLYPKYWRNPLQSVTECMYELPQLTINFTRPQILLVLQALNSWKQKFPDPGKFSSLSVIEDIFRPTDGQEPVLEASLSSLEIKTSSAKAAWAATGTLASTQVMMHTVEGGTTCTTPLLYGPLDNASVQDIGTFTAECDPNSAVVAEDLIRFTIQIPTNPSMPAGPAAVLMDVHGVSACLDPALYRWISYTPRIRVTPVISSDGITPESQSKERFLTLPGTLMPSLNQPQDESKGTASDSASAVTDAQTPTMSYSQTPTQTPTATPSQPVTRSEAAIDGGEKKDVFTWSSWFSDHYPVVKIMEVQVDIRSSSIVLPSKHLALSEPTANIPHNIKTSFQAGTLPPSLVLVCPSATLYSAAHKKIDVEQSIPIKSLEHSVSGEKLPWSLKLKSASVFSTHSDKSTCYLVAPTGMSCTVAVTAKYNPPTSDNITALGLVLHADMDSVGLEVRNKQVQLLYDLSQAALGAVRGFAHCEEVYQETVAPGNKPAQPAVVRSTQISPDSPRPPPTGSSSPPDPVPDPVITITETSDSLSEAVGVASAAETDGSNAKLSLWLQWTLPKSTLTLYSVNGQENDMCVICELEDVTTAIDLQDVYAKVKSKAGAINIFHRQKRGEKWVNGSHAGLLLSCTDQLTKNVTILTNKLWTSKGQPAPNSFSSEDRAPRDKGHGFVTMTFTRALKKNVKKRLRKLNTENSQEVPERNDVGEKQSENVYLNELCVNLEPCDVVLNFPVLSDVLKILDIALQKDKIAETTRPVLDVGAEIETRSHSKRKPVIPLLTTSMLPLLYINTTNFRLFVPDLKANETDKNISGSPDAKPGGLSQLILTRGKLPVNQEETGSSQKRRQGIHDVLMIQVLSVTLTSQADNPLPRVVLNKDLYRKAVSAHLTSQPGSEMEDRQYQLDITGLSMSTGKWCDLLIPNKLLTEEQTLLQQHPALEWNTLNRTENRSEKEECKMLPIASSLDLRVVAAPAITHTYSSEEVAVVCGYSLEINATSDMDYFLATHQAELMLDVVHNNLLSCLTTTKKDEQSKAGDKKFCPETPGRKKQTDLTNFTAFDILLTAGRISLMVYTQSERKTSHGGKVGRNKPRSKSELEWRNAPEAVNFDSFSLDSGVGSFSTDTSQMLPEDNSVLTPFAYATFSQPHSLISCHPNTQKLELSCYDIVLKGANANHPVIDDQKLLPEASDFTLHWIETRPGRPHLKTGIPPSLYTLRVSDFLVQSADIELKIERPIKLNLSTDKLQQVIEFYGYFTPSIERITEIIPTLSDAEKKPTVTAETESESETIGKPPAILHSLKLLSGVHITTVQIVIAMETESAPKATGLQMSAEKIAGGCLFKQGSVDYVDEITLTGCCNEFLLKTGYNGEWRPLIGPASASLSVTSQWWDLNTRTSLPSILCFLDCGVVRVMLGQENVLCFQKIGEHVQQFIKENFSTRTAMPEKNATKENLPEPTKSEKKTSHAFSVYSYDDLRAGDFDFLMDEASCDMLPNSGEILYATDLGTGTATMTWCYPAPRVLTAVTVTPVPFNLPQEFETQYIDESLQIPCVLQYWDVLRRQFVAYSRFYLSESTSSELDLPEPGVDSPSRRVDSLAHQVEMSTIWRVEILKPDDFTVDQFVFPPSADEDMDPLVSPHTLSAAMKVDSAFMSSLLPLVQCNVSASLLQIRLVNHLSCLGKKTPAKLKPFKLVRPVACDQELVHLNLYNPQLLFTHLHGNHHKVDLQLSGRAQVDLLEFRSLTMRPLVEPCGMTARLSWIQNPERPKLSGSIEADQLHIMVGESAVNTLHCTSQVWAQINSDDKEAVVGHSYFICNNTQNKIRLKQYGTDESLVVDSSCSVPYAWRTCSTKQLLELSVEGKGGQWSDPVNLDEEGTDVRVIEHRSSRSTLIIQTKRITSVQKQITISGQLVVASRLSQHLEVKLASDKPGTKDPAPCALPAFEAMPSYVIEHNTSRAIKVKLMGVKTQWSQDIPVGGDKMKDTRLLKIPLTDRGSFIHVWCHIFCQHQRGVPQILVMFVPLFVVRNHLPAALVMNIETPRLKSCQEIELEGQGRLEQLHTMSGDMTHNITFKLSTTQLASSPAISLSSGMIEQVPRTAVDKPDIEQLAFKWQDETDNPWPYNSIHNLKSLQDKKKNDDNSERSTEKTIASPKPATQKKEVVLTQNPSLSSTLASSSMEVNQPNIDLQISLSQRWPGCNTLLIDVAAFWMMINQTDLDLAVIESNEQTWKLPRQLAFAPPIFEGDFQLGVVLDDKVHGSELVSLSEDNPTYRYLSLNTTLYKEGHVKLDIPIIHDESVQKMCYLVLHSTIQHQMRVVTIRNQYVLTNNIWADLLLRCYTLPLSDQKVTLENDLNIASPSSKLKQDSDGLTPLPLWIIPPGLTDPVTKQQITESSAQYLCLCHRGDDDLTPPSCHQQWSVPLRIPTNNTGTRLNVSVPYPCTEDQNFRTRAVALSCVDHYGCTYLVITDESDPSIEIHNHCPYTLYYGQTVQGLKQEGVSIQEETELTTHLPSIPPYGSAHYSFPAVNAHFPELNPMQDPPRLLLAGCDDSYDSWTLHWSNPIDVTSEHDMFVNLPTTSDVKVHIEKVGHTTHVFVEPVSRAEVSAKEIRSRLKGGKEKTVVVETKRKTSDSLYKTPPASPTPSMTSVAPQSPKSPHESSPPRPMKSKKMEKKMPFYVIEGAVVFRKATLTLLDESADTSSVHEVLRVSGDSISLIIEPKRLDTTFSKIRPQINNAVSLFVQDIQIDNQMFGRGNYDFPVILMKRGDPSQRKMHNENILVTKQQDLKENSVVSIEIALSCDLLTTNVVMETVDLAVQPLIVYIEDTFIYDFIQKLDRFMPVTLRQSDQGSVNLRRVPSEVMCTALEVCRPTRLHRLTVQPLFVQLSIHASIKLFIAADDTPLSFGKFERKSVFSTAHQYTRAIAMHYASGALFRAGWVVGSLEILGNPTGLVRNIGTGVADLFRMPYAGLTRGPGAFVTGVTHGMGSLVKHISTGALTSVTNFATSVSRNMERLSLDSEHRERQEEWRRQKPKGLSDGIKQGLTGFGLSLLGAVAGLADQPLQSVIHAPSDLSRPGTSGSKVTGIVSGMGKGLVGAVTKPIGGAAELVSQTGIGLLHGAGLADIPQQGHPPSVHSLCEYSNGSLKYHEKLLSTVAEGEVLAVAEGWRMSVQDSPRPPAKASLLLTPHILFFVSTKDDLQQQAFAVSEVNLKEDPTDDSIINVLLQPPNQTEDNWNHEQPDSTDRVAAFVEGTTGYVGLHRSASREGPPPSPPIKRFEFKVSPEDREFLIAAFLLARNRAKGLGFPLL